MEKSSKILFILPNIRTGGILSAAANFCNGLISRGYQVDLLIMNADKVPENLFAPEIGMLRLSGRASLWCLGSDIIKKCSNPFKKAGLLLLSVIKKLLNKKHMWNRFILSDRVLFSGYTASVAYKQGSACLHLALNCVQAEKHLAFIHGDLNFMGDVSMWIDYLPGFDRVCYVSNGVKKGFVKKYPALEKNAATVYNVFDVEQIRQKAELIPDIVFDSSVVNIVTVSRLENVTKGVLRIPEICAGLCERCRGRFRWYVIGDGPCTDECRKLVKEKNIEDHLFFLGEYGNPYPFIRQADFTVLPSFTEAFPMVVCESLILQTPVIASRYPAAEEQINDGVNGMIAEQSVESLTRAAKSLIENDGMLKKMRENCLVSDYDNERAFEQFAKVLD